MDLPRFVCHPKRPGWGTGRVVEDGPEYLTVYFEAVGPRRFRVGTSGMEEVLAEAVEPTSLLRHLIRDAQGSYAVPPMTFDEIVGNFQRLADGNFTSPKYVAEERAYKDAAVELASELLSETELRRLLAGGENTAVLRNYLRALEATNLVIHYETGRLRKIADDEHHAFAQTLVELLHGSGPFDRRFDAAVDVFLRLKAGTWPLCTYALFVTNPREHLLVKPEFVQRAARALGYEIGYQTVPNARTYANIRAFARYISEKLTSRDLAPRDMIDIQSFLWLGTGGFDEASANVGGGPVGSRFSKKPAP